MAINFPTSPTLGQIYTYGSRSWEWTGTAWMAISATSAGGTTWTQRLQMDGSSTVSAIVYNGSNLYVALATDQIFTSPDGITWTERTSAAGFNEAVVIAYDSVNSLFITAGNNGIITTSGDGITWTARTSNMGTSNLYNIYSNAGTTVIVGEGGGLVNTGGLTYSTNGTTWTRKSQTISVGSTYVGLTYNGTNWIIGTNNSTNNFLYASTPSGTWTAGSAAVGANLYKIFWDGTNHIIPLPNDSYVNSSLTLNSASEKYFYPYDNQRVFGTIPYYYQGRIYGLDPTYDSFYSYSTTVGVNDASTANSADVSVGDSSVIPSGIKSICVSPAGVIVGTGARQIYTSF